MMSTERYRTDLNWALDALGNTTGRYLYKHLNST